MENNKKISNIDAFLMITVSLFYDGLQALLTFLLIGFAVNWLISIWAWLTFYIWFKIKGINFIDNLKRAVALNAGFLAEVIPGFNALPAWTVSIATLILIERSERVIKKVL